MKKQMIVFCCSLLLAVGSAAYAYDETYEKAVAHFRAGEYRRAIPLLEEYAFRNPEPGVYYMLGYACYQLRNFDCSRDYFDQVYLIDPEFRSDSIPAHAGISKEDQGLIHEALELSGAKRQMESYADVLSSSLLMFQSGMSDLRQNNDILIFLRDSYRINKTYPAVVGTFSSRFNKKHMLSVVRWLKAPLGRKIAALESAAGQPGMMLKSSAHYEEYDLLQEGRRQRIRDLERAFRAAELNTDIVSTSLFEMLKGMQVRMQGGSVMDSDEIDMLVSSIRKGHRQQLTRDLLVSLALTYRSLTDDELDEVIRFYRSPAGIWFNDTSIEAVSYAIGRASREVGEKIGSALLLKRVML